MKVFCIVFKCILLGKISIVLFPWKQVDFRFCFLLRLQGPAERSEHFLALSYTQTDRHECHTDARVINLFHAEIFHVSLKGRPIKCGSASVVNEYAYTSHNALTHFPGLRVSIKAENNFITHLL